MAVKTAITISLSVVPAFFRRSMFDLRCCRVTGSSVTSSPLPLTQSHSHDVISGSLLESVLRFSRMLSSFWPWTCRSKRDLMSSSAFMREDSFGAPCLRVEDTFDTPWLRVEDSGVLSLRVDENFLVPSGWECRRILVPSGGQIESEM